MRTPKQFYILSTVRSRNHPSFAHVRYLVRILFAYRRQIATAFAARSTPLYRLFQLLHNYQNRLQDRAQLSSLHVCLREWEDSKAEKGDL